MKQAFDILLVDDEEIVHETLGDFLTDLGHTVHHAYDGDAGLKEIESREYDIALLDVRMPGIDGLALLSRVQTIRSDMPCVVITGHADLESAVRALRLGAADFLVKPVDMLYLEAMLERVETIRRLQVERRHLRETIRGLQTLWDRRSGTRGLVGPSEATRRVRAQVQEVAQTRCETILISGETGTGKEVVARGIHLAASTEENPFIAVSCPAIADTLIESELFGHVKGAFTGATEDRPGYFELADGGTLFLDEVGDLSVQAQAALLRVIETRTFRRVGGRKETTVRVRLIAATNAPLEQHVEEGKFRRDLFYRLNFYHIHLLPLRERREDILPLANHFLSLYAEQRGTPPPRLSSQATEALRGYDFPGNIRELRNIVERAAMICRADEISLEHLAMPISEGEFPSPPSAEDERTRIVRALEQARWNRREAAKRLGISYSALRRRIEKHGLK